MQRLDALGVQRKQLQQAEDTAQITLNQLELEKDALYRQVLKHQRAVKRFQSLETGKYMAGTMEAIQLAMLKTKQKRDTVVEVSGCWCASRDFYPNVHSRRLPAWSQGKRRTRLLPSTA